MFTLSEADDAPRVRRGTPGPWYAPAGLNGGQRLSIDILKEVVEAKKFQDFVLIHSYSELVHYYGSTTMG